MAQQYISIYQHVVSSVAVMITFCYIVQILAEWQGDFATTSYFQSFNTKYLLVPDWRAQDRSGHRSEAERNAFHDPAETEEVKVSYRDVHFNAMKCGNVCHVHRVVQRGGY